MATQLKSLQAAPDPLDDMSLPGWLYHDPEFFEAAPQVVCHESEIPQPGEWRSLEYLGESVIAIRGDDGEVRAFSNVCRHRGSRLVDSTGGCAKVLTCPYHAWTYRTDGSLRTARGSEHLPDFDKDAFGLKPVRVETMASFVFVNLDPDAASLKAQSEGLEDEIRAYCPEIDGLVLAHRATYDLAGNWKNSVDNFLECYHCHVAHSDFCDLVDMDTYRSICHGIYSSHCGRSRHTDTRAYRYSGEERAQKFGSWWLWPNLSIEVFPGAPNVNIFHHVPMGPERTMHVFEFYMQSPTPTPEQQDAIRYIDEVLQVEDIRLVESVQRGLRSRGYNQGRFIVDPGRTDMSEHAVHHFHTLVAQAMAR
jgi:phenylpropionate dioxygenase-like ring-hydroxylating dioxygenase large terminal subunit